MIEVREAKIGDTKDLSTVYKRSWKIGYKGLVPQSYLDSLQKDYWIESFNNWIENEVLKIKVICFKDRILGGIVYGKGREEKYSNWGEIVSLYIDPNYFNKSYGGILLNAAINDLKNMGFDSCYLWTFEDNYAARSFYENYNLKWNGDKDFVEIEGEKLIDVRYVIRNSRYYI